jgi:RNA polymerase sigma-70 factor (ECF subfamily)
MTDESSRILRTEFETLLAGVLERAYAVAYRLTGNRQDAEDLVQEAALNAFRGFSSFQPGTNFRAWFLRILTNCWCTNQRKHRDLASLHELEEAHKFYFFERISEVRPQGLDDPVREMFDRLASEDVARALQALPDEFRVVCTLYFVQDCSYQEIADVLGVPIGTVRSRLHRGRQMLQKRLWLTAQDLGIVPSPAPSLV